VFADISKAQQRVSAIKYDLDTKTEAFLAREKKTKVKTGQKTELEQAEVLYYEASLSLNIMLIHMAYNTIEQFRLDKRI
jgi:hypothetical protein